MARRAGGAPSVERGTPRHHNEIEAEDKILRAFRGVNVTGPRTGIDDNEFFWLENVMPKGNGNLPVVKAATYRNINYAQAVLFETTAAINYAANNYIFTFLADGSATYIPDTLPYVSTQFAAPGTFTAPIAIPYTSTVGVEGLLIVDPVKGYFDFNLTTSLTLTPISNGLILSTSLVLAAVIASGTSMYQALASVTGGTGLQAHSNWAVSGTPAVSAGGTLYSVGDVLQIQGGASVVRAPVLTVTSIGGGGAVTGVSVTDAGLYTGPLSGASTGGTPLIVGPALPAAVAGGAGSGATFNFNIVATGYTLVSPGSGYAESSPPQPIQIYDARNAGPPHPIYALINATPAGTLNGTALAAYAGRVWVANGKSISFTDVGSYNSFGGAGGQLTINDAYLNASINALFAANGFLYIFGDDSIDTLSNVQVAGGVTSFSRVNLTASIGTSYQQSIYPYYRSIAFANKYGFYLLSGATPQKISDSLDTLFSPDPVTPNQPAQFVGGLVGGSATVFGELCMCWTLRIVDGYTTLYGTNVTRTLIVVFFKGRWFFYYPGFDIGQMVSIPTSGTQTLHGYSLTGQLYELFSASGTTLLSFMQTKLWDGGDPILDKEVVRAALSLVFGANVNQMLTVTTDNEYESFPVPSINNPQQAALTFVNNLNLPLQFTNNSGFSLFFFAGLGSYGFLQGGSSTQGGKYFGMSVTARQTDLVFSYLAEQFRATRPW